MNNATEYRQWLQENGMKDSQENRKAFRKVRVDAIEQNHCTDMINYLTPLLRPDHPDLLKYQRRLSRINQ